ncbi:STAS domain-containing protein [Actinoplanes sp. NPDC051475]|uniref:STAS domain-containing protein n=1 Tax=Actinoplanes sp. NPDC051475 TaxID=3157225 RepID=UPI00344C8797
MFPSNPFYGDDPLVIQVQASASAAAVVTMSGEVDVCNYARMQQVVIDLLLHKRPAHVLLDMGKVTFLDAAGIRALLTCRYDAEQLGIRLKICAAHKRVRWVLTVCDAEHLLH